jgi:membrane protein DedA with SNARE-associated domain
MIAFVQPYFVQWGYLIVFLTVFLENSAFLGVIVPGDAVLLLAGFYAQRRALGLEAVIAIAFTAAVLGDTVAYTIGRFAGRRIMDRWGRRFLLPQERLERFDRYFAEYGMWAVALGRMAPVIRTFNTFAAGMSKMPFPRFLAAIVLAAGTWSVAVPILGYLFSGSLELVRSALGWGGAVIFILFIGALYLTYRRMIKRLEHEVEARTVGPAPGPDGSPNLDASDD